MHDIRRRRDRHLSGRRILVALALLAVVAAGCSFAPAAPSHPDEGPAAEPEATATEPAPPEPVPIEPPPPVPVASEPKPTAPAEESHEVSVEIDDEQRATLTSSAARDLEEAERAIRSARARPLSAAGREKVATIEGLVAAARDATKNGDLPAAAALAHKARLLAQELVQN